jgi:hypothetical protein
MKNDNPTIDTHGNQYWTVNGELHRTDGPAVIDISGSHYHYKNGPLHRQDGPAIIDYNGCEEWYINNERHCDNKSFKEVANLSDEDMTAVVLKYGNIEL